MSRMQLVHLHRTSYGVLDTACVTLPCRAYRDPPWDMRKTIVFGMPSEGSVARGYSVPNFGGVFGMGVKTQTARNDAAPTHHQDRATGRSRPVSVIRASWKQPFNGADHQPELPVGPVASTRVISCL